MTLEGSSSLIGDQAVEVTINSWGQYKSVCVFNPEKQLTGTR